MNATIDQDMFDDELENVFNLPFLTDESNVGVEGISYGSDMQSVVKSLSDDPANLRHVITASQKRRKLPGPAGLLPKAVMNGEAHLPISFKSSKRKLNTPITENSSIVSSQHNGSQNEENELLSRVQLDCGPSIWPLVEKYSIANMLQMVSRGELPRGKVPVMCGFLSDIELSPTDAKALLKDATGFVGCTIHRSVIKQYREQLAACVLLLLKQISLFSPTGKKYYMNLTLSNIVRVYTLDETFPTLKSSKTTHGSALCKPMSYSPPFTREEFDSFEVECLRPTTPPKPLPPSACPTLQLNRPRVTSSPPLRQHLSTPACRPSDRSRGSHPTNSSPVMRPQITTTSDVLDYRLRVIDEHTANNPNCMLTPLKPGLGSLVRQTQSTSLSQPLHPIRAYPSVDRHEKRKAVEIEPVADKVATLLDDDMDDLLSSVADDTFNLWTE